MIGDESATHRVRSGGGPGEGFLVDTRRGKRGWICGTFQMPEDLPDHLALRDGGDDPQHPPLTPGAARHVHRKDALEQPRPAPARRRCAVLLFLHTLLARRGDDRPTQVAVRRQTAPIAHQVEPRQGHEGGQLLQEFHRREPNPNGAVRPRMGERGDEIAVGVLCQALQGHRAAGGGKGRLIFLYSHMPDTGNWHGGTFTRWSAALSAASAPTGRRTRFHGVLHPPISLDQHCLVALFFLHVFITSRCLSNTLQCQARAMLYRCAGLPLCADAA